ncbi:MAG TPA: AMP-binding protein [Ilumatobacter sp.]|nr:AMP-binding protein [Ilumatobacter sp.]
MTELHAMPGEPSPRGAQACIITDARHPIPVGAQTVAEVLDETLATRPDALAVVGRSGRLTYAELDAVANRAANALIGLGVQPGDRVGAALPNDVDIVVAFLGAMRIGAIWVGVPRVFAPPEKAYLSRDAELSVLLADPAVSTEARAAEHGFVDGLTVVTVDPHDPSAEWAQLLDAAGDTRPDRPIDPFAPAAIAYTSGTTGRPKGVVHSQHNILMPGAVTKAFFDFPIDGPIASSAPFTLLNLLVLVPVTAFQVGTSCVVLDSNKASEVAEWIEREQIMHLTVVPTVYHDLLGDPSVTPRQLASLTRPRSGGAAVTETLRERWFERFGTRIASSLAMTEGPTFVTEEDRHHPPPPGALGTAARHLEITIRGDDDQPLPVGDVGEICVAPKTDGPWAGVYTCMLGYWNAPDETARALRGGVLHTGDVGRLDEHGHLFLVDRKSSLIIRGGSNIYPAEVERAISSDARVAECAVVARPDERLGETTVAFVRLRPDADLTAGELREHCALHLSSYKVPDEIRIVDDFPRSALGKIKRAELALAARS